MMVNDLIKQAHTQAQSALSCSPIYDLRDLHVEQLEDALLIQGKVDSFYHKQLAQEAVRLVSSGIQVVNQIDVEAG